MVRCVGVVLDLMFNPNNNGTIQLIPPVERHRDLL